MTLDANELSRGPYNMRARRFPTAPLREALQRLAKREKDSDEVAHSRTNGWLGRENKGLSTFCKRRGITERQLYREYLTDWSVDTICVAVGLHPSEIYPDWTELSPRLAEESEESA